MTDINWKLRLMMEREAQRELDGCAKPTWRTRRVCETHLRAIWVDGPDSEAARAGRGEARLTAGQNRAVHRALLASVEEDDFVSMSEADCRAMWEELVAHVRERYATEVVDASAEYMEGWRDACDGVEGRMLRLAGQRTPDPDRVPAVRRVVAWTEMQGREPEEGDWLWATEQGAYEAAATERIDVCLKARGYDGGEIEEWWGNPRHACADEFALAALDRKLAYRVRDRWASLLRHRDEEAGWR